MPETLSVTQLMAEMRRRRQRAAIVMDEYGGTAGFATWEDLLERVIGDIPDEYSVEQPEICPQTDGVALVDGLTLIEDVNEHFDLHLDDEGYDTIGGFVFAQLGRQAGGRRRSRRRRLSLPGRSARRPAHRDAARRAGGAAAGAGRGGQEGGVMKW